MTSPLIWKPLAKFTPRRTSASRRGYGGNHRKLRRIVLSEEPKCRRCDRPATDLDHIDGDPTNLDRSNLQPLCGRCHKRKTYLHDGGLGNGQ